ncbi:MAG: aliphatic sulfonate ABC transporter substrate-binding protein [Treponema sp.]|jgi:sulfonate transport system substrate-binding protein|nr:aliphatic sulfonate ABC transporter substrate-binding protein [Treponema sp.]
MKIFRKTAILLLVTLVAVSVTNCSKTKGGTESSGKPIAIRFGNLTYPEPILASVKGFFEEELKAYNATIEIITFQSGPPQVEALAAKALDFAAIGDQPAVQAIVSGVPVKIVSGIADATEAFGLIARTDSGIKEVKDIKGHKIAAPAGTTAHQLLLVMLEKNGLTMDDIEYVNLANASITASLVAGDVESATAFGVIYSDPPVSEGVVKINSGEGYKRNINVIVTRTEFLEKYPDVSVAVLRALQKAAKWRVEHYDETIDIVADWTGYSKEVTEKSFPTSITLLKLDDGAKDAVLMSMDILFKNGLLSKRLAPEQLFDDKYTAAAGLEVYPGWVAETVKK